MEYSGFGKRFSVTICSGESETLNKIIIHFLRLLSLLFLFRGDFCTYDVYKSKYRIKCKNVQVRNAVGYRSSIRHQLIHLVSWITDHSSHTFYYKIGFLFTFHTWITLYFYRRGLTWRWNTKSSLSQSAAIRKLLPSMEKQQDMTFYCLNVPLEKSKVCFWLVTSVHIWR